VTEARIVDAASLGAEIAAWRAAGLRVGLVCGDFDVLVAGHARVVAAARATADRVVVAVAEDADVTRRRGESRPVLPAAERARLVAALRGVDRVAIAGAERLATLAGVEPLDAERGLADPVERLRARSRAAGAGS